MENDPGVSAQLVTQPTINAVNFTGFPEEIVRILAQAGYRVRTFGTETEFLQSGAGTNPGCVLTRIQGTPTALPAQLQAEKMAMPVIVVAESLSTNDVVVAMKSGAVDVLTIPCHRLLASVQEALELDEYRREWLDLQRDTADKVDRLSPRQREVLEHIAVGKPNKVVARDLFLSPRTVEKHRREVLHRIGASNVAEAAALWERYQLPSTVPYSFRARPPKSDRKAG